MGYQNWQVETASVRAIPVSKVNVPAPFGCSFQWPWWANVRLLNGTISLFGIIYWIIIYGIIRNHVFEKSNGVLWDSYTLLRKALGRRVGKSRCPESIPWTPGCFEYLELLGQHSVMYRYWKDMDKGPNSFTQFRDIDRYRVSISHSLKWIYGNPQALIGLIQAL